MRYSSVILICLLFFQSCKEEKKQDNVDVPKKRPNIVFIMADDHAEQAISAYGHPIGQLAPTPNIDRIANEGALFKNNFCTNSICGPSRAVILTGKFSHVNGFKMNGNRFDGSQQTFPKLLQKAGYNTAMIGKWHLHGNPEGYDYWNILKDQGNYYNPDFIALNETTKLADTTRIEGYATDIITEEGLTYLKKVKDADQPFMLMLQHKAPHRNWMPALRHANKYDSIKFPLPDTYFTNHEGSLGSQQQLQTIYKDMYEGHDLKMTKTKGNPELAWNPWTTDFERMSPEQRLAWDKAYRAKNDAFHDANLSGKALAEWKGQRYLQEYLATIASVDEGVGRVLDYLEKNGLAENTIVIYTTDQGFYLGEKGWFDKRYMYEESLAMPLLVKYPNAIKPGTVIEDLTQNLDFAETFLDYAQAEIPEDMQGKSLRPLLEKTFDETDDFRDAVYYHYYDYPAFHMVKKHYGIRTKRYKLMHFFDDINTWELYDLEEDPKEINNQIDNPEYDEIEAELRTQLAELQKQYKVTDEEFKQAPKQQVERAYKQFERLRGHTGTSYNPETDKDTKI
ncbi:sulfatase [Winogradskyella echinorum]|uniref:Sulfatase n=1 Tax=Winogradskyella echinorum TaxID=538189 RepID=A0ABR6XXN2_9FLAO|nr:sulfatase [Winogradskyella echinorum]MBC3845231.1 sulfatase [Winogradskyella echinorum]MBC5749579.1 sulfatase [Winogradskyella echinorum]